MTLASNHRPLQIGLILAVSLHAFDEMVITIALPTIVRELGGGDLYGVSLASYILASLISVVWAGKSIDRRNPCSDALAANRDKALQFTEPSAFLRRGRRVEPM